MKLLVLSDLHVEHSPFTPHPDAVAAADVVVLAGDILGCDLVASWARSNFPQKHIVLISGNHELYRGHWDRSIDLMRDSARAHDVHFLENDAVTIAGVRFLGTTLWTDFAYFGEHLREESIVEARAFIADYRLIKGCTPQATIERHFASRAWLQRELAVPGTESRRVVVTHHYPRKKSTPPQYRRQLSTAAFGSQLPTELVGSADLWIHGHTHTSFDYRVERCRVVCNPRGYPLGRASDGYENPEFDPALLLDLDSE